ncbi:hypothetical protein MY8738_008353 [Beauveria namnaoensis]
MPAWSLSSNYFARQPLLDVWRKQQGVACWMYPSAAILSKRAGAANGFLRRQFLYSLKKLQVGPSMRLHHLKRYSLRNKMMAISEFLVAASLRAKPKRIPLRNGAKRIRTVIGSGRRSEAA